MSKGTRRSRRDDTTTFTVTLCGPDLIRWHEIAKREGLTLEQLVKASVDLAWLRGSTR